MSKLYEEYVARGDWRCRKSPTGAHHWRLGANREGITKGRCQWCMEARVFKANAHYG